MGSVLFGHGQRDSIGLLAVCEFNFLDSTYLFIVAI
jgi:hypothetical protein